MIKSMKKGRVGRIKLVVQELIFLNVIASFKNFFNLYYYIQGFPTTTKL